MRIHVLSDLHLEFAPFAAPAVEADVVVVAGDGGPGLRGIEWAAAAFAGRPVVYVAGNHEYYGGAIPHDTEKMRARAAALGVHFLEDGEVTLGGVRFLGCTLWTDFHLDGPGPLAMIRAQQGMNDFRRIRRSPSFRRFTPTDAAGLHAQSLAFLRASLARGGPCVVVTHHAPSLQGVQPAFRTDPLTPAYASHLDGFVAESGAALWIHGHTHVHADYRCGDVRVVSNARGYPAQDTGFDPAYVVEI